MKKLNLNKTHRYIGIVIAPFLLLQAISGLLLDFGLFRRRSLTGPLPQDDLLVKVHYGAGLVNDAYHILLGIGIAWMVVSGWLLYLRFRRISRKNRGSSAAGGPV